MAIESGSKGMTAADELGASFSSGYLTTSAGVFVHTRDDGLNPPRGAASRRPWLAHLLTPKARSHAGIAALLSRVPARVRQFAGWFTFGVIAFGIEVAILGVLHQRLGWPLWLASATAAEFVLLGRFLSTDRFVFGYARPTLGRCWRFHAAAVGSFVLSWIVLNGSAALLDLQYVIAAFLGSVAAFAWSGLTNFLWVWRPVSTAHRADTNGPE